MNLLPLGGPEIAPGAAAPAGTAEGPPFSLPAMADPALATTPLPAVQVAWNAVPEGRATILQTEQPATSTVDLPRTLPQICPLEPVPACAPDAAIAATVSGATLEQIPEAGQPPASESPSPQPSHHARPSGSAHRPPDASSALPTDSAASGLRVDVADMLASPPADGMPSTTPEEAADAAPATWAPEDQEQLSDFTLGQTIPLPSLPAASVPPPTAPSTRERISAHGSKEHSAAASRSIAAGNGQSFAAASAVSTDKSTRPGDALVGGNDVPANAAHSGRATGHERVADASGPPDAAADRRGMAAPGEVQPPAPDRPAAVTTTALAATDPGVSALPPPARSSAPPTLSDPAPRIAIASPRFVENVGIAIARKPGGLQPGDELVLQIEPADFGQIRVELRFAPDGKLEAVVSADQSRVLDQLRAHAADLHRSLVDAGGRTDIAPPRFEALQEVMGGLSSNSGQAGSGGQSGQQHGHPQHGQRHYLADPASPNAPPIRPAIQPGRLDLIA